MTAQHCCNGAPKSRHVSHKQDQTFDSLFEWFKFRGWLLTQHQEHPPQPVLSIKVTREVCGELETQHKRQKWLVRINMACTGFTQMSLRLKEWMKKAAHFSSDLRGSSAAPTSQPLQKQHKNTRVVGLWSCLCVHKTTFYVFVCVLCNVCVCVWAPCRTLTMRIHLMRESPKPEMAP